MPTLLTYAQQEANNVWKAYKYRRDCMLYIGRFAAYEDFGYQDVTLDSQSSHRRYLRLVPVRDGDGGHRRYASHA